MDDKCLKHCSEAKHGNQLIHMRWLLEFVREVMCNGVVCWTVNQEVGCWNP